MPWKLTGITEYLKGDPRSIMSDTQGVILAKRAVQWLYEENPVYVVGACSTVSEVLVRLLRRRGFLAKVVYGLAARGKPEEPFFHESVVEHAWLEINGEWFDPVLWVQGRGEGMLYRKEPKARPYVYCGFHDLDREYIDVLDEMLD